MFQITSAWGKWEVQLEPFHPKAIELWGAGEIFRGSLPFVVNRGEQGREAVVPRGSLFNLQTKPKARGARRVMKMNPTDLYFGHQEQPLKESAHKYREPLASMLPVCDTCSLGPIQKSRYTSPTLG